METIVPFLTNHDTQRLLVSLHDKGRETKATPSEKIKSETSSGYTVRPKHAGQDAHYTE
jgi:hypothetical protein